MESQDDTYELRNEPPALVAVPAIPVGLPPDTDTTADLSAPIADAQRIWWLAIFTFAACALAGGTVLWLTHRRPHSSQVVHFFNGLDMPVHVTVGEQTLDVPSAGHAEQRLPFGPCRVKVADGSGRVLEQVDVTIPDGHDFVGYNVLGASPVMVEKVVYSQSGRAPVEAGFHHHIGARLMVEESAHYVLEEPPEKLKVSGVTPLVTKHHVMLLGSGGWSVSVDFFDVQGHTREADTLRETISAATGRPLPRRGLSPVELDELRRLEHNARRQPGPVRR